MNYKDRLNELSLEFDKKLSKLSEEYDILDDELDNLDYEAENARERHRAIRNRMREIRRQLNHGLINEYNEAVREILDDKVQEIDCLLKERVS